MDLYQEAIERFGNLLDEARKSHIEEPRAAALATADSAGRPSVRTVTLAHADGRGFVFHTDVRSRKARELEQNPRAALCFYWQSLGQQVIVEGPVEGVSGKEADEDWMTRRRDCQIAAWASRQSDDLEDPAVLEAGVAEVRSRFRDRAVPRPPEWAGFRLMPERIEFWNAGWHYLHTRTCYRKRAGIWSRQHLYP